MAKEFTPSKLAPYLLALPAVLVGLVYLPTLQSQFVWDDVILLVNTPLYRDPTLWREALRNPLVFSPNYFRPLAVLTIMGELRLWGLNPAAFHLTSLLLHALNSTLVALLARELLRPAAEEREKAPSPGLPSSSLALALAVGVVYGLHPALAEAVAFVSSRFDLLVTTFLLLALLAHARWRGRKFLRPLGVGLAFLAAALTKEMAIVLPPALVLWSLALARPQVLRARREVGPDGRPAWRNLLRQIFVRDLRVYVAVLAAGVIYLVARYSVLGYLYQPRTGHAVPAGDALQHMLLVGRSLAEYVLLVVWPFTTLTPVHYSVLPVPLDALAGWLALAVSLGILIGLGWLLRKKPELGALPVAGVLGLAPVVNLIPLQLAGGTLIAERFLTFPLALMALGVGALLARSRERIARAIILLLWLVPCVITVERTLPRWRDDLSLWSWAAQRAPRSSMPHSNLAQVYLSRKDYSKTVEEAGLALERDPLDANAWNERGVALYFSHRYSDAQAALTKATELQPTDALFWSNLAGVLRDEGKFEEAERILLDKALRLNVTLPSGYLNLGILYLAVDRPDLAVAPLRRAAELSPPWRRGDAQNYLTQTRQPERWLHLGYLRLKDRDFRGALEAFDQAEQLGAAPAQVAVTKGAAFVEMKQWPEAKAVLEAALRKAPNDAYLNNNLGVVAQVQGDLQAARRYYARAAALDPNWALPRQNLARLGGATARR